MTTPDLHPDTNRLVDEFAATLKQKLAEAQAKHGYTDQWRWMGWEDECRRKLTGQVAKGDPVDVAAYAAFCWAHGWSSSLPPAAAALRDARDLYDQLMHAAEWAKDQGLHEVAKAIDLAAQAAMGAVDAMEAMEAKIAALS